MPGKGDPDRVCKKTGKPRTAALASRGRRLRTEPGCVRFHGLRLVLLVDRTVTVFA